MLGGKKEKLYILGRSGFLGSAAITYFRKQGYVVFDDRIEITDRPALEQKFKKTKPDVVINFAGVRAYPNIDWCEDHKSETVAVNVGGAINAMLAALEVGAYPIQISSGCIYSGGPEKLFTEEDEPNFYGSFYSRMRIALQNSLKELPVLQARIRMPASTHVHPRNFITKVISYKKVVSAPNSITLIEDLLPALEILIKSKPTGVLNLTNEKYIKNKDIAGAYKKIINPAHENEVISISELEKDIVKAKRSNCVLSVEKAKNLGIVMPELTRAGIEKIIKKYSKSLPK